MPDSASFLSFIDAEGSQSEKPHHQAVSHCLPTHSLQVQPIRLVHLLKVTGYSLLINIHVKILPSFSSYRIQACMRLTLPLNKVTLVCNSCAASTACSAHPTSTAGWVGGACNLIAVPAVNNLRTNYWFRRQLFPVGRTSYRILHCIWILRRQTQGGSKSFRRGDLPF